jgi:hypothetical protein
MQTDYAVLFGYPEKTEKGKGGGKSGKGSAED